MKQSAEMLLKKMGEDKTFAEKILSQTEKGEVIEIAKGEGIELTLEDIDEINESIAKVLQLKKEGELTEEELESVAGGGLILFSAAAISAVFSVAATVSVTVASASVITTSAALISLSAMTINEATKR